MENMNSNRKQENGMNGGGLKLKDSSRYIWSSSNLKFKKHLIWFMNAKHGNWVFREIFSKILIPIQFMLLLVFCYVSFVISINYYTLLMDILSYFNHHVDHFGTNNVLALIGHRSLNHKFNEKHSSVKVKKVKHSRSFYVLQ